MRLLDRFLDKTAPWRKSARRIDAARRHAEDGLTDAMIADLRDAVPGVRRAAARGLGWRGLGEEALKDALIVESSETVRAALEGALRWPSRPPVFVGTFEGPLPLPSAFDPATETDREAGTQRPDRLGAPEVADGAPARSAWLAHAAACPPGLAARLPEVERAAGRRMGHVVLEAIGICGDPAAAPRLRVALAGTTDPGRGFRERRLAAVAYGRLGDPIHLGALIEALATERSDYEGRPGAGLGVQEPVRCALLWAMGELGDARAAAPLVTWLGAADGHASHLWAIGALTKLGIGALPIVAQRLDGADVEAANAAGVLGTYGPSIWADRALADPRPAVREACAASLTRTPATDALTQGLAAFAERRFYDAHEILEAAWRISDGERRVALQGLIQGAVALEHLRRGNPREARGQWTKARAKLDAVAAGWEGLDLRGWCAAVEPIVHAELPGSPDGWPVPVRERR